MMSLPSAKRPRAENAENAPITRSDSLWIDDGNVVLQAENTQFRIHWSTLARHSSVFRDMRGLPQPPDEPSVDGCPVVHIPDDPADVEYLLKALYNPTFHSQKKLPLPAVGALIRLGRKYGFKDLLHSAVARVTGEYPTTLAKYDAIREAFKTIQEYDGISLDMVTLLIENDILTALPAACYRAVRLTSLDKLFDGILGACLSRVDLRRCVIGQQRLFLKQFEPGFTFGWARKWNFHDDCTSPAACRTSREELLAVYMEDCEIFAFVKPGCWGAGIEFCDACTRHATEAMAAGRKKMWQELPESFDLPPWNQLKNDL